MPPASVRRPERATLDGVAAWLEAGFDRAAARAPNPGSPSLHRMNRHEYANAVRDLLDLEVDVTALLPSDSTVAGFDNIADVLGTSPALAQSYVSAAMKISRLAVGDLTAPPVAGDPRRARRDVAIRPRRGPAARHPGRHGRAPHLSGGCRVSDPGRGRRPGRHHNRRHAHPRRPRSHPRSPPDRGRSAWRPLPGFDTARMDGIFSAPAGRGRGMSMTITGPFRPSGPGDTPSRRRIFVCPACRRRSGNVVCTDDRPDAGAARVPAARAR